MTKECKREADPTVGTVTVGKDRVIVAQRNDRKAQRTGGTTTM
jgi:hypothetical protein